MKDGATNKSGMNTLEVAEKEAAQHVVKNLDLSVEIQPIAHGNALAVGVIEVSVDWTTLGENTTVWREDDIRKLIDSL